MTLEIVMPTVRAVAHLPSLHLLLCMLLSPGVSAAAGVSTAAGIAGGGVPPADGGALPYAAAVHAAASADAPGTIHGTVRTDESREPIGYATVEVVGLDRRVSANARGYFVLAGVPEGTWRIRATAIGYRPLEVEVGVADGGSVQLDLELPARPVEVAGVDVEAESQDRGGAGGAGPPAVRVDGPTLSLVPGLAEADVFRALQTLPAIAAASDFSSALYVRGGSQDQTMMLLDGAPVFNPYHLGGLFAAFDPATVGSVDVMPGGMPAGSGDRLSGTVELRTRDGGRDRVRGQGAVGLISSRASVDGPLPGGDGSYLLSVRRTYLDLLADAAYALDLIPGTVPYGFSDAHLKLTHDVGGLGSVSASVYVDDEGVGLPEEMRDDSGVDARFDWGTRAASVHYRQPLGATLLAGLRVAWSEFYGSFEGWELERTCTINGCAPTDAPPEPVLRAYTSTRDALASADLTWYQRSHEIRTGVQFDAYRLAHDIPLDPEGFLPEFRRVSEPQTGAAYVEDVWQATDALRLRAGLRLLFGDDRHPEWLPRIGARLALTPRLSLSVGAGRYAQVLHSLRNPESVLSSLVAYDLLDAVPAGRGFSTAEDVVLGVEWANASTSVRLDAYAKRMDGLLHPPVPDDAVDLEASPIAADGFLPTQGTARGVELYARHARGDAEVSLAYALTFADRSVDGERFPPRFHRRHTLNATGVVPLGETGRFSARLALADGQPYTPVHGIIDPLDYSGTRGRFTREWNRRVLLVGEHNAARLPGYLRLDVGARKSFDKQWFGADVTVIPYLQVINVLNSKNVLFATPRAYSRLGRPELSYAPQLPVVPTIGVEWSF